MFRRIKKEWIGYASLTLCLLVFFMGLGGRPLAAPDEGRYAEIPREMVASGDYITPHLDGLKYFEKPPLVYWLEAMPLKFGFDSEFFLRLPIALFAVLGCFAVYAYTKRIYSQAAGYWSAIVLGTSVLYFSLARIILLDLVMTVFLTIGLLSFIVGLKIYAGKERRLYLALSSAAFGCAVLTKGLGGIVLPIGIIGLWVISLNKWKDLKPLYLPTNLLIFSSIVLPWHVLVSLKNPGFLDFYLIHEHLERYLTPIHRRVQPFWFFIPITIIGFFPWIIFLPRAVKNFISFKTKDWKIYDLEAFLLIWILFIFLFFSFSSSKLIPYILPIFPPLAIIVGRFLAYVEEAHPSIKMEALIYWVVSLALAFSIPFFAEKYADPRLYNSLMEYFLYIKVSLVGSSTIFLALSIMKQNKWSLSALWPAHVGFLFLLNNAAPLIQKSSMKPFATYIKTHMPRDSDVVFYGMYAQDLPYYLGRTVKILNWSGELDHGKNLDPENDIFLSDEKFKALWRTKKSLCVITKKNSLPGVPFPDNIPPISHIKDDYVLVCKK